MHRSHPVRRRTPQFSSQLTCAGPATSARGRYADRSGWVTFEYTQVTDVASGEVTWFVPPTLTIDFS